MLERGYVSHDDFPAQGDDLLRVVEVGFNLDASRLVGGVVVRDDLTYPHVRIVRLADGRHVLGTECQYRLARPGRPGTCPHANPPLVCAPCRYTELYRAAREIAADVGRQINRRASAARADTPYKAQAILEMVIDLLQKAV